MDNDKVFDKQILYTFLAFLLMVLIYSL